MRGPLLSGPLGSASSLEAITRWVGGTGPAVVIGPLWMGQTLATRTPVLLLAEAEERARARRVARRAAKAGHHLVVALAGVALPLRAGSVGTLLIENASGLDVESMTRWMGALVPTLRPGGRLIAADASADPAVEARLAGLFLGAALTQIAQERPRDGVVLTVGTAPPAAVIAARFGVGVGGDAWQGESSV